jgi:hypothetical protein
VFASAEFPAICAAGPAPSPARPDRLPAAVHYRPRVVPAVTGSPEPAPLADRIRAAQFRILNTEVPSDVRIQPQRRLIAGRARPKRRALTWAAASGGAPHCSPKPTGQIRRPAGNITRFHFVSRAVLAHPWLARRGTVIACRHGVNSPKVFVQRRRIA